MAFFDNLKTLLKQKWLQFFQVNRSWIILQMDLESVYTPDGGRRPPSSFILGVVNALEPQLAELMFPFSKLNPDADTLIDVLELNFDPDLLLGNRFIPQELSDDIVIQTLTELDLDELSDMSLDEMAEEVVLVETDDASVTGLSAYEAALVEDIALDEMADEVVLVQTDDGSIVGLSPDEAAALADAMVLDELGDLEDAEEMPVDQSLGTPNIAQQTESGDVLSDVWVEDASSTEAEGTGSKSEQADNETHLGKEKQSEDDEISRLFPNL